MEDRVLVVAALGQHKKVLAGAGRHVAVQLQIQIPQAAVVPGSYSVKLGTGISFAMAPIMAKSDAGELDTSFLHCH